MVADGEVLKTVKKDLTVSGDVPNGSSPTTKVFKMIQMFTRLNSLMMLHNITCDK